MWNTTVQCLERYILPAKQVADLVINNNAPKETVAQFIEEMMYLMNTVVERVKNAA
jgi:hypothetical protein